MNFALFILKFIKFIKFKPVIKFEKFELHSCLSERRLEQTAGQIYA